MKRIGILLILATMISGHLFAQDVTYNEAKTIAELFLSSQDEKRQKSNLTVKEQVAVFNEWGEELYYIFNFEDGGFVIVAGDKRVEPILAYSKTNSFSIDNMNPAVEFWMSNQYEKPITALKRDASLVADAQITKKWADIASGKKQKSPSDEVEPLLTSQWNQNRYYNTLCPEDPDAGTDPNPQYDYDFHVPNGCVALAMAQIMYYHRHPRQGEGEKRYLTGKYGRLEAKFGETVYDYEAMSDVAENYSDAIARLIFHLGVSVEMNYAPDGSGAQSDEVQRAISYYFKYDVPSAILTRENFTIDKWKDTIKSNLNAGLPVYYAANSNSTGRDARHAFVCDGYDQNDRFHINWGWGGSSNGYYSLDTMNAGSYRYTLENRIIVNIKPYNDLDTANFFSGTKTLNATYGSFNDGSGRFDYRNNTDCAWLISPQNGRYIRSITLKVSTFSLSNGDSVYIYEGGSAAGNLLFALGGDVAAGETYTIPASEAFVVFKSDASNAGKGFTFTYTTVPEASSYCSSSMTPARITTKTGTVSNGTPNNVDYLSSTNCYWAIAPGAEDNKVRFAFSKFDLNYGDYIDIFGYGPGNILGGSWNYKTNGVYRFSKEKPPVLDQEYTIDKHTALIMFRTDNNLTASGFEIYWGRNSMNEPTGNITDLSVFPNPSNDYVTVDLTTSSDETVQLSLYDLLGKKVYAALPVEVMGNYTEKIDVNNLAKGVYMLRVETKNATVTKKVVIK